MNERTVQALLISAALLFFAIRILPVLLGRP